MNVYSLLADAVRRHPDNVAVACGGRSLTYRAFDRAAAGMCGLYASLGCAKGDRIVLFLRNGFEYPALLLATMRGGFIAVPVNAKLHPVEVAWIAGNAEPKVIVTHREVVAPLRDAMPAGAQVTFVIVEDLDLTPGDPAALAPADVSPDDAAWIFYTSGTTGKPKGALLSHRNLIAMSVNCLADIFDFQASDRVLHVAPLSHGSGLYLPPPLMRGAANIVYDRPGFRADEVLDFMAREKVTALAFVAPTMIVRLLEAAPRDDVRSLRGLIYGGAPIHLEHIRAAVRRFGPIFHQLYGQGESPMTISCLSAADHLSDDDEVLRSAGQVRSGVEVRILDDDDRDVPYGGEGEICIRGDVVMKGYWRNPEASAEAMRGGWLHTGDVGRFDAGGRLHVLDRRHDTIISGGANIYPKEIEDVVAAHPGVREAIAFGVSDREWGESVMVAVALNDGTGSPDAAEILEFCRERLAGFKKPRHVIFVDELPKNAYGKVLRREMKRLHSPA